MEAIGSAKATINSVTVTWTAIVKKEGAAGEHRGLVFIASLCQVGRPDENALVDRRAIDTFTNAAGQLEVMGSSDFHFLHSGQKYAFLLRLEGREGKPLLQLEAATSKMAQGNVPLMSMLYMRLPKDMWRTFVGEEHELGQWLAESPEDIVWTTYPTSFKMMHSLWINACFTLPSQESPIMQCPNPICRYCLDLTKGAPWLKSKKVRRHKNDFCLTVNAQFADTFNRCERTHTTNDKGTWITPELVAALDRSRREDGELKVYSIELWEKASGKLAAAIMALSVGDIFHDYTTATMVRDARSAGAILTKVVGHLLTECGFSLWYWGFKNPYMAEYDGQYGGVQMDNKLEFWPRWQQARSGTDSEGRLRVGPRSLVDLVLSKSGNEDGKLDLASLS